MSAPARRTVENGYDLVADQYLATKDIGDRAALETLDALSGTLAPGAAVLDLGCGAGIPSTRWLAQRFAVTGVDVSGRQLELARHRVPEAILIQADMTGITFAPETFDAVVAFHSIIHVPREEQPALCRRIYRWIKPGGLFLTSWATGAWEGEEPDWNGWGATMWWSHYDKETNLRMLREAGFSIRSSEVRIGSNGEAWLWSLARKRLPKEEE